MPETATNQQLNRGPRLHAASILYFLSRFAVVAFVFAVPVLYFLQGRVEVPLVAGGAGGVIVILLGYYISAASLRCAACGNPVLMDNGNRKHPYAKRIPGLNHRARVAWDILFKPSYQCMYCNTRCRCKKNWNSGTAEGKQGGALFPQPARTSAETFPESVFGGILGGEGQVDETFTAPEDFPAGDQAPVLERVVTPSFSAATVFPGSRTLPVSVAPPKAPSAPSASGMMTFPPSAAEPAPKEAIEEPSPVSHTVPTPPSVPWAQPVTAPVPTMNRTSQDHPAVAGSNPFLAAAATMPPPPTPKLPYIPSAGPRTLTEPIPFHQEFPSPGSPSASDDGPPPWTLPSPPAAEMSTPPPPARVPAPITAPILLRPPVTPVPQNQNLSGDLLKDVIAALEDGRRALTDAFQSLIGKLESKLAVPAPPLPAVTAPVPDIRPRQEPATMAPSHQVLPSLPPVPPFLPERPRSETVPLPLPAVPEPPPVAEPSPFTAPRKKFVRPAGLAAQQLNHALSEVFETPATPDQAPGGNGHLYSNGNSNLPTAFPIASEPAPVLSPAPPSWPPALDKASLTTAPVPAWRPPAVPENPSSPFAVSEEPLTNPPVAPPAPAPFTFLKSNGDHFAPAVDSTPATDPLDDSLLPWMQPVKSRA